MVKLFQKKKQYLLNVYGKSDLPKGRSGII